MPSAKKKKTKNKKANFKPFFVHYAYCLTIIALLLASGININNYLISQKVLGASVDISPLQSELNYWQNLANSTPTFTDAYLQLAKINVQMGNTKEAEKQIVKALNIDPNNPKIIEVQNKLSL